MDFITTMASNYCFLNEGIKYPASYALQDVGMSNTLCCCGTFHLYFSTVSMVLDCNTNVKIRDLVSLLNFLNKLSDNNASLNYFF